MPSNMRVRRLPGITQPTSLGGEEWRPIEGYQGYEVSNLGRVRCVRILAAQVRSKNYLAVGLYSGARLKKNRVIHRLVCEAFHGPGGDLQVAHLDGDPTNNRADNLTWATPLENEAHKRIHGTRYCSRATNAKLTEDNVREIWAMLREDRSRVEIGAKFGVHWTSIRDIENGRCWAWLSEKEGAQ